MKEPIRYKLWRNYQAFGTTASLLGEIDEDLDTPIIKRRVIQVMLGFFNSTVQTALNHIPIITELKENSYSLNGCFLYFDIIG